MLVEGLPISGHTEATIAVIWDHVEHQLPHLGGAFHVFLKLGVVGILGGRKVHFHRIEKAFKYSPWEVKLVDRIYYGGVYWIFHIELGTIIPHMLAVII